MNKFKFGDKVRCIHGDGLVSRVWFDYDFNAYAYEVAFILNNKTCIFTTLENELTPATDWVKCSERMPDCDGRYLVMCNFGDSQYEQVYFFNSDRNEFSCIFSNERITHWMPLPATPAEVER